MERFVFDSRLTVAFGPSDSLSVDCKTVRIFAYSSTYARAVNQKVWNEAKSRERDWGETLRVCEARAFCARKTLTPRFTDFCTDFLWCLRHKQCKRFLKFRCIFFISDFPRSRHQLRTNSGSPP